MPRKGENDLCLPLLPVGDIASGDVSKIVSIAGAQSGVASTSRMWLCELTRAAAHEHTRRRIWPVGVGEARRCRVYRYGVAVDVVAVEECPFFEKIRSNKPPTTTPPPT